MLVVAELQKKSKTPNPTSATHSVYNLEIEVLGLA